MLLDTRFIAWSSCLITDGATRTTCTVRPILNRNIILADALNIDIKTDRLVSHADKATNSIERDENFVPATRSDWKLPAPEEAEPSKYAEILEEAPIVSLFRLFIQQALGLEAYLMVNAGGNPMYPAGTNVS